MRGAECEDTVNESPAPIPAPALARGRQPLGSLVVGKCCWVRVDSLTLALRALTFLQLIRSAALHLTSILVPQQYKLVIRGL